MIISGITADAFDGIAKWVMYMLAIGCGGSPHPKPPPPPYL